MDKNPGKPNRAVEKDLKLPEYVIRKVVNEYAYGRGQSMSEETRENRLTHGKRLLNKLNHEGFRMRWLFSDVENFKQDQNINRSNDKRLYSDSTVVPSFQQLWWFCYSSAIREIPCLLYSSSPSLRVNVSIYQEILESIVKPWIDSVQKGRPSRLYTVS